MDPSSLPTLGEGERRKEVKVQLLAMAFVQRCLTFENFLAAKILLKNDETQTAIGDCDFVMPLSSFCSFFLPMEVTSFHCCITSFLFH